MDKESIIQFREKAEASGKPFYIIGDNMMHFIEVKKDYQFLVWDDEHERLYQIRLSDNQYDYNVNPFVVEMTTYENIQYMTLAGNIDDMTTALGDLESENLISTDKKMEILTALNKKSKYNPKDYDNHVII